MRPDAACTLSTLFIGVMQVGAAPFAPTMPVSAQAQQPRYTHKNISVLHMSAARCDQMKKAFPLKASDPNLCVWVHTEEYTDFIPTPGQAVTLDQYSPLSGICISGTRNFNDTYAPLDHEFSVSLITSWLWGTTCAIPTLTRESCVKNFSFGVVLEDPVCTQYTTSVPSRAALQEYWEQWPLNIGNEIWDRRECYIDINSCNWTTDLG